MGKQVRIESILASHSTPRALRLLPVGWGDSLWGFSAASPVIGVGTFSPGLARVILSPDICAKQAEQEGCLCSLKEDPNVSAFRLTLKPEQGAEPPWLTRTAAVGEARWGSLARPRHGPAALGDSPSHAQPSPEPALHELLWATGARMPKGWWAEVLMGLLQTPGSQNHRMMRIEETSEVIESNLCPNTSRQGYLGACQGP